MSKSFTIIIRKADEGGFYAECPALPGCFSQGETLDELRDNMREAIELYLESSDYDENVFEDVLSVEVRRA